MKNNLKQRGQGDKPVDEKQKLLKEIAEIRIGWAFGVVFPEDIKRIEEIKKQIKLL